MILDGATDFLGDFRFIKVEVANFESYAGCCQLSEMDEFIRRHGFRKRQWDVVRAVRGIGTYYDVTYEGRKRTMDSKRLICRGSSPSSETAAVR